MAAIALATSLKSLHRGWLTKVQSSGKTINTLAPLASAPRRPRLFNARLRAPSFLRRRRGSFCRAALAAAHPCPEQIFGDIEGKLDVLRVECTKCDRKGRYDVHELIESTSIGGLH